MSKYPKSQACVNHPEREYDHEKELCPDGGQVQQPIAYQTENDATSLRENDTSPSYSADILQREVLTRSSSEPIPIPSVYSPTYDGATFPSGNPDSNRWIISVLWDNPHHRSSHRNINDHIIQESDPTMWQPAATSDQDQSCSRSESHFEDADAMPSARHTLSSPHRYVKCWETSLNRLRQSLRFLSVR